MHSQKRHRSPSQDVNRSAKRVRAESLANENNMDGKIMDKMTAGQIEFIRLENFMCHRNLGVNFTSGVNVVTGNNGSGKSAILAGLQVALGSKARSTNRGASIKDVIKEGEDSCRVTVHICNRGPDAFDPHIYGDRIVVIRRLSKNSSSYRLQSAEGELVSTSVKQLRIILDHFNIHLDNPCTVMNQDVSRLFLANETPSSKYRFFLEGTQLQRMIDDHETSLKHKVVMERAIEQKQEALEDTKRELDRLKKEFEDASHLKDLDRQIAVLDKELLWAIVKEKEDFLAKFQENYEKVKSEYEALIEKKKAYETEKLEAIKKCDELIENITEKTDVVNQVTSNLAAEREEFSKVKKLSVIIQRKLNDWETRIRQSAQDIQRYKKDLQKLEKASHDSTQHNDKEEKMKALEQAIETFEENLAINRKSQDSKVDEISFVEAALQDSVSSLNHFEFRLKKFMDKFRQLRVQNKNPLSYFPEKMNDLIKDIVSKKRSFHKFPIGPIGLMVKVKDPRWAGAVELALKNTLSSFIVDNSHDRQLLMSIAGKYGIKISAITQKYKQHVYSESQLRKGGIPDSSFYTILGCISRNDTLSQISGIKYDDEAYATTVNVLIDQANIAQTVLAKNDDEGKRIMFARHSPPNVQICFSMNGSKFQKKGQTEVVDPRKSAFSTLWAEDFTELAKELESEKVSRERELRVQRDEVKKLEGESRSKKTQLSKLRDEEKRIQKDIRDAKYKLDKLKSEVVIDPADKFKEDITFKQNQIIEETRKQESLQAEIESYKAENEDTVLKTNAFSSRITALEEQQKVLRAELNSITQQLENTKRIIPVVESNINTVEREIAARQKSLPLIEERIKEKLAEVEQWTKDAIEICPERLHPTQTKEEIKNKRVALNKSRVQEQERFGGRSIAQIESAYIDYLRSYNQAKESVEGAIRDLNIFEISLDTRHKKWKKLRKDNRMKIKHWFNVYLSQKGHSGELKFDFKNSTLETIVLFKTADGKLNEIRDTKALSGGERSFTTTAFLLSLWKVVEAPFRCLDEFDVFMDAVYRKVAFNMLLDDVFRGNTKQLIIITPLSVSMLKGNINIIRLKPPARDGLQQTTLHEYEQ